MERKICGGAYKNLGPSFVLSLIAPHGGQSIAWCWVHPGPYLGSQCLGLVKGPRERDWGEHSDHLHMCESSGEPGLGERAS